jgi:ADP-ribosylglycohydrolase
MRFCDASHDLKTGDKMTISKDSRKQGALCGLSIGDALAMPVHWYYNRSALMADYGYVTHFLRPRNPHPDSILWRSSYSAPGPKGAILHDQAQYWGQKGIHYHQFLLAGENTLNIKICRLIVESVKRKKAYDADDFLAEYISFMTTPGRHKDTYIEECHRHFFSEYARGADPKHCAAAEKHIGGLPGIVPLVVFYSDEPETAREVALAHLALTHSGPKMEYAAHLIVDLLLHSLQGIPLDKTILGLVENQANPLLGHPFTKWLSDPDEQVIGPRFSTACYVEDSVPAVVYLALKYNDDPEQALIRNTNLGGDNAGRGAVLGALMGAAHGIDGFPKRWVEGLLEPLPEI